MQVARFSDLQAELDAERTSHEETMAHAEDAYQELERLKNLTDSTSSHTALNDGATMVKLLLASVALTAIRTCSNSSRSFTL